MMLSVMKKAAFLVSLALLFGCRGSMPRVDQTPEQGMSAALIGLRVILPTGEANSAELALNLEGQIEGGSKEIYRLPLTPGVPLLYQIEPGLYKITPTRGFFGAHQPVLKITIEGRAYQVPFPREILRVETLTVNPTKLMAIGMIEATLAGRIPGREPSLKIILDDSVEARRALVQEVIRAQMDPKAPANVRASAIGWTRALEQTLSELLSESRREPAFKAVP